MDTKVGRKAEDMATIPDPPYGPPRGYTNLSCYITARPHDSINIRNAAQSSASQVALFVKKCATALHFHTPARTHDIQELLIKGLEISTAINIVCPRRR